MENINKPHDRPPLCICGFAPAPDEGVADASADDAASEAFRAGGCSLQIKQFTFQINSTQRA
jgi:hypothetical protein